MVNKQSKADTRIFPCELTYRTLGFCCIFLFSFTSYCSLVIHSQHVLWCLAERSLHLVPRPSLRRRLVNTVAQQTLSAYGCEVNALQMQTKSGEQLEGTRANEPEHVSSCQHSATAHVPCGPRRGQTLSACSVSKSLCLLKQAFRA